MKLIIACVNSDYDVTKISKLYPNEAILVTSKSEFPEKVFRNIDESKLVIYDKNSPSEFKYVEYARNKGINPILIED